VGRRIDFVCGARRRRSAGGEDPLVARQSSDVNSGRCDVLDILAASVSHIHDSNPRTSSDT
jgi:hypothetical protein